MLLGTGLGSRSGYFSTLSTASGRLEKVNKNRTIKELPLHYIMLVLLCCLFTVHTLILPFSMMSHRDGSKVVRNQDRDTDCTPDCASPSHAHIVLTSVALGNLGLVQHCSTLCSNVWRISDQLGRTALHVAASRGHTHITDWLIARKRVAVDTTDGESGWSALHRSIYYGEIGTAISLAKVWFVLLLLHSIICACKHTMCS